MFIRHGFKQGVACPNLFHHPTRRIFTSVHGDDFTSTGPKDAFDWLEEIVALDIGVTGSALQLVAMTKIALGSSEGFSLAESLDAEDFDAVVRLWGY